MKNKPRKWALVAFLSALFVFAPIAGIEAVQNAIPMVAAEEAVAEETAVQNGVAKVGDTEYATIDEAIANWTNGTTLTLLSDVTLSDVIQLSSTEYHILDLGTYTMTAASGKDAIQYVVNGRTSASYALDIKADATNPGGITATGKTVVSHIKPSSNAPTKDRPITRFYGGVFNASYVVKQGGTSSWGFLTSGYTGASAPYFQFYGGEYNGTIYTNRSQNQFYGGVFNGSMQMSVDSSAYTQVAGGTFKNLSNSMGSTLNSDKFVIGTAKGANNGSVCIDENGNYVVTTTTPTAAEASVASNYNSNNYFYYSTVNTNGMYYEDVYDALEANATGTVTVFTEELDLEGSSFKGIIVVPEGKTITIITAADENPTWTVSAAEGSSVTYTDKIGNELVKAENGSFVEKLVEVATYDELVTALADGGKIKLTADITVDTKITAIDGTTIDLNSKTLYVNVENSYYNNVTIKNGNIVLGKDDVHVCDGYFLVNEGKALVVDGVKISSSEEGIKGYAVFHLKTGANLELINSELNISDNEYSAGYIVYAGEATATVDVVDTTVTGSKVNGIVHATTVIENSIFTITNAIEHGINRSGVTITNSEVAISGGTGRGITAQHGPLVIDGSSKVTITDMGEATIELRNNQNLTIAETATVTLDAAVNNTTSGTITGTVILPPMGNNFNGYIGTDAIWGEVWGNARESFVIKVLDANGNVMGTTSLNNIDGILDGDVNVTWSLKLDAASNTDEYWTMEWTNAPSVNNMPANVELWVDGVKVSGGPAVLSGPDSLHPIFAAVTDENGVVKSFVANDGFDVNNVSAKFSEAIAKGGNIVLLRDVALAETLIVPAGVTVTLDLNGKTISQEKACTASYSMIENKGNLTITGNGKISFKDTGAGDSTFGWGAYTLNNSGVLVVENGTIENLSAQNKPGNVVHMYCAIQQAKGSTTINGGTISTPTYRSVRINGGALNIIGGTFEGQVWLQPNQGDVTLDITGGTFAPSAGDASSIFMTNVGENKTISSVEISGGTFTTKIGCSDASKLQGAIIGGTFTEAAVNGTNEQLLSEDFTFVKNTDGTYGVVYTPAVTVDGANVVVTKNGENSYNVVLADGVSFPADGVTMTFSATGDANGMAYVIHKHEGVNYIYVGKVIDGKISFKNTVGFSTFTVVDGGIQDAIIAAAPSGTVEVLSDITVDKWIIFAESLTIGNGNLITLNINGLTINGNNHTLTIKSIESASNGNYLFYNAENLNINNLTIQYTDSAANQGGIGLQSGKLTNVNFVGGGYGVFPGAGEVTITGCNFKTNSTAIYFEEERNNLVVTGNTFELGDSVNVILLRGGVTFTGNNVVSGRTVNVVSGSPVVTDNDFNDVRFKVYNVATATITENTINNLVFNDATITKSTFTENTMSDAAEAALDAVTKVAQIGETKYNSLAEAVAAAQTGDTIVLLLDVTLDSTITLPAGITLNGNGKFIDGAVEAGGDLTFVGYTKITTFHAGYNKPIITIGVGATLELTTTGRMVIGHGATFNITGDITNAKTANTAELTPSLIAAGASFTGAGVNFNVTNAYVKFTAYCSSKNNNASNTFNINVTNSIWEQSSSLVFSEPTDGKDPTFKLTLTDSVLNSTSHLVFAVTKGEIVFDNSNVNVGVNKQLENRSTLTIKNGSVVYAAHATSSNAKNPGTTIVENATYVATGEFSGSDVGTGTLIVKNGANVTMGKITKANIVIDATGMAAGDVINFTADLSALTGTIEVQNNDKLEAEIVDGKIVLKVKPVASINGQGYATLEDAFKAATEGCVIEILTDVVVDYKWDCRDYATNGSHSQFKESVTINGNSHTIMFTGAISDGNWNTVFRFEENATINNLTIDISEATGALRVITAKKSLTVDDLTIIGSARYGIIFGEGATATDFAVAEIVIRNSTLTGTRRAISDNEGGKDVKSIVITGNTLNANVYASASESIVFNNNTAASEVDLRSYTADTALTVEAQGNTLNTAVKNYILAKTITAQDEFAIEHPAFKVATKAELNAALAAAQKGDTIILTADIDYGTDQLKIEKAITLDLGGNTLTTRNAYGGISVKNNPTIKNGTIVHASNTAAIKVWNAVAFEDLVIDVQGKGDANKTIGGIVLQSSTTTRVDSIKNVTIKGAALTNGIETYNCGDATENVIGSMENVTINANGTGMIISAPCGTATGCTISGGNNAIEIFVKGTYSASLDLVDCDVEGGIFAHDEFSDKPDIVNNGTLNFTADAATTGVDDVTLTLARAENVEGILKDIKDNAQATVNNTYYATLEEAVTAAQSGDTIKVFAGTYAVPAMKAGVTIEGEVNADGTPAVLFEGTLSGALEDLTMKNIHIKGADAQRWAYAKGDLVFENVTFEATSVYALHFDGITEGTTLLYKDCTIIGWAAMGGSPASCVFDGCTIKDNGRYGVIRTYFDTTIENCTFNVANANLTDIYQDGIHAVGGAELVVDNCTNENGDMEDLVNISGTSVVVLDGVVIKNVAKIGDAYYETLAAAIEAADGDVVIELLADVTLTETLDITKPVTLGLNGYTITSTDKCAVEVSGGNKDLAVVIENGSIVASAIEGSSALSVYDGADVTLNNVALSGGYYGIKLAGYHSYPSDVNNNNLTSVKLKGGSVTAENAAIIGLGAYPNTQIDIDGTTVTSTDSIAIYHPSYGTLNITDGTITGTTAIYMKAGNLNISGGKFVANGEKADYEYENSGANATGDAIVIESCNYGGYPTPAASITGGTFTSANNQAVAAYKSADADAVIGFVKGGTFNTPVAEALCAVGYAPKANEDGTYGVRVKEETKFAAANLTIGVDLSVNFYVTGEPEVGDAVMNFAIPSLKGNVLTSSSEATEVTINGQTMWKFTFKGVGPHLMGKQLTATLVVEGITTEYKYSIQEYAMKELSRTAEDLGYTAEQFRVYREFLVNLLNYGAESQKYMDQEDDSFTISEEELVTYYLTEEQKAYMTHYHAKAPYEFANQKPQGVEVGKIVRLGTRNKIEILFRDATNAENNATKFDGWFVRVYGNGYLGTDIELKQSDKYADCYSIMIEDILVTYYDNNYEIFIYNAAGEQVGIIEYSIQEYVYNTQDTTKPAAALVKALWNYYHAAEDYIDEF